jgi:lipid II:glycine glycyltransferase (peptidoglycan interpeptide bridge formation enzyme)
LGTFASLNQRWSPQITNWLPFFWNGYQQSVRYTYRLNQIDDKDSIWKEMAENRRRNIKKAEKLFNVEKSDDPSFLYELVKGTFNRKDLQVGFIENNLINLYNACFENNASSIFYAQLGNEVIAGILVVYDAFSAYYLVGGVKDEYLKSGAMSLLLWTAITDSSSRVKCFDFEGSMNRGIESFFSSFASVQTPYYEVNKSNSVILTAIDSLRKVNSVIRK